MRPSPTRKATAIIGATVLAAGLVAGAPAFGQDDLKKDVEELKKGQQQILQQIQELKQLIQSAPRQAPTPSIKDVVFDLGANPTQGSNEAKLILVEFTDYQ